MKRLNSIGLTVVVAAMVVIYLSGLGNTLVFDDILLTSGQLFVDYGGLDHLKPRLLSYGSFVWVHWLAGGEWWPQRVVNVVIHLGVVLALWGFYREVLRHIQTSETDVVLSAGSYRDSPALILAIGFFALNPVAVYAVAYLIQRSILLATLFVVLALWSFVRGLANHHHRWMVLSMCCYVLAVLSKEHAMMAPLAAVPLYVLVARPSRRRLAYLGAAGMFLVAAMAAVLSLRYGDIIGKPFDQYSNIYLAQLARLGSDVERWAYPLSILNQAYLFFSYGLHWLFPYAGWMSIDMRPPFPVAWLTVPHIFGAVGYLGMLAGGAFLTIRYRDWRALVGLSLLLPGLLFMTEFVTVWVQDPFVLYRSYLWAIGLPGLVFFLFHGLSVRVLLLIGGVIAALFVWQGLDRVASLSTPERVWSDAIEKLPNDPRSVGRWFPYLNRGNIYLDQGRYAEAVRDFRASASLGDEGMGSYNIGALLFAEGKYRESLAMLDLAKRQGYSLPGLGYQQGIALLALRRPAEAYQAFSAALGRGPRSPEREEILAFRGRAAMEQGLLDVAISDFRLALSSLPEHKKANLNLGMAYVMKKEYAKAYELFSRQLGRDDHPQLYYGRALAGYGLNRKAGALSDIGRAIQLDPDNAVLREWQDKIRAMP